MRAVTPTPRGGFGMERSANLGLPRRAGRRTRWMQESAETEASPGMRRDEYEAVTPRSRGRGLSRLRFRHRARIDWGVARAEEVANRGNSGSEIWCRGSGAELRHRRERSACESRPTWARRSNSRPLATPRCAWRASAGSGDSREAAWLNV